MQSSSAHMAATATQGLLSSRASNKGTLRVVLHIFVPSVLLILLTGTLVLNLQVLTPNTVTALRETAHDEASKIALHLVEEPAPPMPSYLLGALSGSYEDLGSSIDKSLAEVKEKELRKRSSWSVEGSAPAGESWAREVSRSGAMDERGDEGLDKEETTYRRCREMKKTFQVDLGVDWGLLDHEGRALWKTLECDWYAGLKLSPREMTFQHS